MNLKIGESVTITLDNGHFLDVSTYPSKWTTEIVMDVWTTKRDIALTFNSKTYLNFNKFLPLKVSIKIATWLINKQSQKVAGINLVK